jgi:hypothetical protein
MPPPSREWCSGLETTSVSRRLLESRRLELLQFTQERDHALPSQRLNVLSFSTGQSRVQISNAGGANAKWSRNGREVVYLVVNWPAALKR